MVIEPRVVQFWSEIILVISNRTRDARSFNFEIMRMISAQIALSSITIIYYTDPKLTESEINELKAFYTFYHLGLTRKRANISKNLI